MIKEKIDYEEEPVWYCRTCLSMKILNSSGSDQDIVLELQRKKKQYKR